MEKAAGERHQWTMSWRGRTLHLGQRTLVMGVLNATPDSFSDGGVAFPGEDAAAAHAVQLAAAGADIIDIGGESSRPGAAAVSEREEIGRVLTALSAARRALGPSPLISVDTYKAEVARRALDAGADIINCLGGLTFDPLMGEVAAAYRCPLVLVRARTVPGGPRVPPPPGDVLSEALSWLGARLQEATRLGIDPALCLLDPGIGFGISWTGSARLLCQLPTLASLGRPLVVGVSRKAHLGTILQRVTGSPQPPGPTERLDAALAETALAVMGGAQVIRTHDVAVTRRFVGSLDLVRAAGSG